MFLSFVRGTKRFAEVIILSVVVVVLFASPGFIVFGVVGAIFYEDTSKEVIVAKVSSTKVERRGLQHGRYEVFLFKLKTNTGEWWSNEEVRIADCPVVVYNQPKEIWLVTHKPKWVGSEYRTTEGVSTFCR